MGIFNSVKDWFYDSEEYGEFYYNEVDDAAIQRQIDADIKNWTDPVTGQVSCSGTYYDLTDYTGVNASGIPMRFFEPQENSDDNSYYL